MNKVFEIFIGTVWNLLLHRYLCPPSPPHPQSMSPRCSPTSSSSSALQSTSSTYHRHPQLLHRHPPPEQSAAIRHPRILLHHPHPEVVQAHPPFAGPQNSHSHLQGIGERADSSSILLGARHCGVCQFGVLR